VPGNPRERSSRGADCRPATPHGAADAYVQTALPRPPAACGDLFV